MLNLGLKIDKSGMKIIFLELFLTKFITLVMENYFYPVKKEKIITIQGLKDETNLPFSYSDTIWT